MKLFTINRQTCLGQPIQSYPEGTKLIVEETIVCEDWKTACVRLKDYPPIPKGSIVEYLYDMINFYGRYVVLKGPTGYRYYANPNKLELADPIDH